MNQVDVIERVARGAVWFCLGFATACLIALFIDDEPLTPRRTR